MNLNKKSKKEQIFLLVGICVACLGVLCISGCGSQSCETLKCASQKSNDGSVSMNGISVPGLGGCSDSCLCQGVLCAKSHKLVMINGGGLNMAGCDTKYNSGNCGGCNSGNSCYSGCVSYSDSQSSGWGFFYGDAPKKDEQMVGCVNGGAYCGNSENLFGDSMEVAENIIGID
ncbi:MAG: hypothetical protein ACI4GV_02055 [Acutalibacteraceae bacterium]